MKLLEFQQLEALHHALIEHISQAAKQAIAEKGFFTLVLAGGNTPKALYQKLAKTEQQWEKWRLIYGDERHLALGDKDRNSSMIAAYFLSEIESGQPQHFAMPFSANIEKDAEKYAETIAEFLPVDFALLGIGEDGHTASLFPKTPAHKQAVQAVYNAPKPPAQRLSLSAEALKQSQNIAFLATGKEKQAVIQQGIAQKNLPFSQIANEQSRIYFYA